ncbi:trichohyalin-like [Palaemon carinicauda]|uniref:trichohyalin-like n=1 Tax=Palaemon carinicauda TaxID=392227 RepID=UPI0035B5F8D4
MQHHQNKGDGKFVGKEDQTDLFKKEIEDFQQKLRERDSTIGRMEGEIGVRTRQTEQLQNRLIEDERRSNHLEGERDRYAKLLKEKESQIRYFEKEQANRNKKLDRLCKELETLRNEMDKTKDNLQEKVEMIDEMLEYNGRIENEYERKLRENEVQKLEEDKEIEYWKKEAMIVKKKLKLTEEELQEENSLRKNLENQLNQMKREATFRDVIGHLTEEESKDEIERQRKETQDMIHRLNEEMELNRIKDSKIQQLKEEKLEKDIANEYWEKETLKIDEVLKDTKSELQLEKTVRKVLEEELNIAKQEAEELRQDKLRAKTRADNVEKLFEEVEMMIERKANELKIVEEEKENLKGKLIKEENLREEKMGQIAILKENM